jgi:hypothetical protein
MKRRQPIVLDLAIVEEKNDTYYPNEQVREFLYCIAHSYPLKHACAMAGVNITTMQGWLNPNHSSFKQGLLKLYDRAQAVCLSKHVRSIHESRDWKAHAFWLERHEASYAPREKGQPNINQPHPR